MEHFNHIGHAAKHIYVSNKYLHHIYGQISYHFLCFESENMHILKITFSVEGNLARS